MTKNGIIVQDLSSPTGYISGFKYNGINAFHQYPLMEIQDEECRRLTDAVLFKPTSDGMFESLEFISDSGIFREYMNKCAEMNKKIRALFIESDYEHEVWNAPLPELEFLGYEYCEIPFDCQIITDFDWYEPFKRFYPMLNEYGVFDTLEDVTEFKKAYDVAFEKGDIGDGDMDTYICRVYEVKEKQRKKKNEK